MEIIKSTTVLLLLFTCTNCQRPIVNSSTAATSMIERLPSPSNLPTPRTRSDLAKFVFMPGAQQSDTNNTSPARNPYRSPAGKFHELKNTMRNNGSRYNFNQYNNYHDPTTFLTNGASKASAIDAIRKLTIQNGGSGNDRNPISIQNDNKFERKDPIFAVKAKLSSQVRITFNIPSYILTCNTKSKNLFPIKLR